MMAMKITDAAAALGVLARELTPDQAALIRLVQAELADAAEMAVTFEACTEAQLLQHFAHQTLDVPGVAQ